MPVPQGSPGLCADPPAAAPAPGFGPSPALLLFFTLTVGGLHLCWLQLAQPWTCHPAVCPSIFCSPTRSKSSSCGAWYPSWRQGHLHCPSGQESFIPRRSLNPVNTILIFHSGLQCSLVTTAAVSEQPLCPIPEVPSEPVMGTGPHKQPDMCHCLCTSSAPTWELCLGQCHQSCSHLDLSAFFDKICLWQGGAGCSCLP